MYGAGISAESVFPLPPSDYPALPGAGLIEVIQQRALLEPFNIVATAIFLLAIVHTFLVARVTAFAHRIQHEHNARQRTSGAPPTPSVLAECLHFFGESKWSSASGSYPCSSR